MAQRPVRFYFDADLLGLAKTLATIREDITYPGDPGGQVRKRNRPASPITTTDINDEEWIPVVADLGWSIITRDSRIVRRPAEKEAVATYRAKLFTLAGRQATHLWPQLEIIMSRWRDIERASQQSGPFIYIVTRSRIRQIL